MPLHALLTAFSIGVAGYALVVYGLLPLGSAVHPDMRLVFETHPAGIYWHVFPSLLALTLGPFQFWAVLRQGRPALHRFLGRVYLLGVLAGGVGGLYMAQFAFGGAPTRIGFALLASLWLLFAFLAYRAIRARDIRRHRAWMVRTFALTFAAVTLRLYLGLAFALGMSFEQFYPWLAWLSWVPNLLVAEGALRWGQNRAQAVAP
jgi:uncharacterized membrane protein